jgi:hypothetical protein
MRGFLGILGVLLIAMFAGAIGFWAGVGAGAGNAVVTAGTVPAYVWWGGPHLGGLLFGFLFLFLIIGLIAFAFGGRRRGPWGRGWQRGGWGPDPMGDPSDPRRQWIAEAHRRLHEEDERRAAQPRGSAGAAGGTDPAGDVPPAARPAP